MINIDLELRDKTLNFIVSPIHATIIWHFQEQGAFSFIFLNVSINYLEIAPLVLYYYS